MTEYPREIERNFESAKRLRWIWDNWEYVTTNSITSVQNRMYAYGFYNKKTSRGETLVTIAGYIERVKKLKEKYGGN